MLFAPLLHYLLQTPCILSQTHPSIQHLLNHNIILILRLPLFANSTPHQKPPCKLLDSNDRVHLDIQSPQLLQLLMVALYVFILRKPFRFLLQVYEWKVDSSLLWECLNPTVHLLRSLLLRHQILVYSNNRSIVNEVVSDTRLVEIAPICEPYYAIG